MLLQVNSLAEMGVEVKRALPGALLDAAAAALPVGPQAGAS